MPSRIAGAPTALDATIRDHPDDVAAHLAYAEILTGLGDPHGALIRLHHALAQSPDPSKRRQLQKQEAAWLARHGPPHAGCDLTWQLGFVRALVIRPSERTTAGHVAKVLAAPAMRFLRAVRIDPLAACVIDGCVAAAPLPVRELEVVCDGPIDAAQLAAVLHDAVLPDLHTLRITASAIRGALAIRIATLDTLELRVSAETLRFTCDAPKLRALTVVTPELARDTLGAILHRVWPLQRLGLFARAPVVTLDELAAARVFADLTAVGLSTPLDAERLGSRERLVETTAGP